MNMSAADKILVFSETRVGRILVGVLSRKRQKYVFTYERAYQRLKNAIPLGPELPLWRKRFVSKELFPSLADRIPSRRNPAYEDYCWQWGIDPKEEDPFVLLTTIGRRGPSTFVFERDKSSDYGGKDVRAFRKHLGLSQRELEQLFGISHATLVNLESGHSKNPQMLKFIELCDHVPFALEWLLKIGGQLLHDKKRAAIMKRIEVNKFWQAWESSPAAQLLVPKETKTLCLGEEDWWDTSYAFMAFEHGLLGRLDELVKHFEISSRCTDQFRGRLKEDWLDRPGVTEEEKDKRRRISNQTPAALVELVVAEHLECRGYEIVNLEAWDKKSSDIVFRKAEKKFNVEVKYFPPSPEWDKAFHGEGGSGPLDDETLNYFFFRIAEAAIQLPTHGVAERVVWLVFDRIVEGVYGGRKTFDKFWMNHASWYERDGVYHGVPEKAKDGLKKEVLSKNPQEWLKETGTMVVSTLDDWRLRKIEVVSGKLP